MAHVPLRNEEKAAVFVLYSIHNVMKAEKVLKSRRIAFDTIPVPKEISSDCGMAILSAEKDERTIGEILEANGIDIKGIYLRTCGQYERKNDR